jgi:hypothetical protein
VNTHAQYVFTTLLVMIAVFSSRESNAKEPKSLFTQEDWEMGPFEKLPQPVLRPDPNLKFHCPNSKKTIAWQDDRVYSPAVVVKDGKVWLLTRSESKPWKWPDLPYRTQSANRAKEGFTGRVGLAWSKDGRHFTQHPTPVLYPDNSDLLGRSENAQVRQFTLKRGQSVADLPQRVGAGHMAKKHGDELGPASKALGALLSAVLSHEMLKFRARKVIEELTEQTRVP